MVYIDGPGPSTGIAYQLRFALGMMANKYRSFVSGTSIIIIQDKPGVIADAVTKSNLLAQITADDQKATDYEGWYRSYEKALSGMGWVIDALSAFQKVRIDKEMVTVASMMKQVMGSSGVSADLFSGYNSTITALLEENSTLLDNLLSNCAKEGSGSAVTHHSVKVAVQVILGYQVSEDSVTMILGLFYFSLDERYTKNNWLLIEVKSSEIEMFVCVQKVILNLAIWDQVKDGVTDKLIQNSMKEVLKLQIT